MKFNCPICDHPLDAFVDAIKPEIQCPNCGRYVPTLRSSPPALSKPLPPPAYDNRREPKTSGFAVASMVLGAIGLVCIMIGGGIFSIPAIILGHLGYSKIARNPSEYNGKGLAIAGFTLGYITLFLGIAMAIILLPLAALTVAYMEQMLKMLSFPLLR